MKRTMLLMSAILFMASCHTKFEADRTGFEKIDQMLQKEFGAEAYYTAVSLSASEGDKYVVIVDKSEAKDQLRQERWVNAGGDWENAGVVNMQINAAKPAEFYKFQLGREVQLPLLGSLIDSAKSHWAIEQQGKEPKLQLATANTNNTIIDDLSKYQYTIILSDKDAPEQTHSYTYDRDGKLIRSN